MPYDQDPGSSPGSFCVPGPVPVSASTEKRDTTWGNKTKIIARILVDRRQAAAQRGVRPHGPEKQKRPRRASELPFGWWQVQDLNLRRLSRRFYST
ncbi:hypothetical protein GCM10010140_40380 [Streptosporangium pseudovulgare]|uniref:Uncharacterized protein n=1 Tax=Streptosporangium pseudovulgare TaxID=35765 RepID=A0ABQ2R1X1_9ACTN|nr:hypothetical protein GCM10010140_40380 [Streptosporangium pseudovulgare]